MPAGKTNQGTGALLQKNINSVRSRLLFVDVATGVSRLLVVLALLMSAGMMLDWGVDLSRDGRGLLLIVYASVASIMVWGGVLRPFFNQPNDDEIALIVERGIPDFRSRLIASLQLSRTVRTGGESSELVGALVDETEEFAKPRDLRGVISMELFSTMAAFAFVLLVAIGVIVVKTPNGMIFLKRIVQLSKPYPYETRITLETDPEHELGIVRVPRGGDVTFTVHAEGVRPDMGRLEVSYENASSGSEVLIPLPRLEAEINGTESKYFHKEEDVRQSFSYVVHVNDGRLEGQVKVVPRPLIRQLSYELDYPDHTGEANEFAVIGSSQLGSILAGSKIRLDINATKRIRRAELWLHKAEGQPVLGGEANFEKGKEEKSFSLSFNPKLEDPPFQAFHIHLKDADNIKSQDDLRYGFSVHADQPPVLRILSPPDEDEVVSRALPVVIGTAEDLYGITELSLRYRVLNLPENLPDELREMEGSIDINATTSEPRVRPVSIPLRVPFDFQEHLADLVKVPLPSSKEDPIVVEYWLEGRDNNKATVTKPGESSRRTFEIVSIAEKQGALRKRMAQLMGKVNKTREDQEEAQRIFELLLDVSREGN